MTRATDSLARRFMAATCLVVLSLVVALGLVEAALRLLYPMSDFLWQWDSRIGMKLIPGKQGRSVKPGSFDVTVSVNAEGFRDRDHAVAKDADVVRVVLLGDSFVEALQVPFENSITAVLQQRLQKFHDRVETINFGVSGSGTARQYLALREYGLRYQPDLVLLFFVGNDVADNNRFLKGAPHFPYPRLSGDGTLLRDHAGEPLFTEFAAPASSLPLPDAVKQNWQTYRFLRQLWDHAAANAQILDAKRADGAASVARQSFGYFELYRRHPLPQWAEAWTATEQLLLATRDLAYANKARFAVVLVPSAWEVYPEQWKQILKQTGAENNGVLDREHPSTRLRQFLQASGVTTFDLLGDFGGSASKLPPLYIQQDAHWTSEGHRLAGDLVAEAVAKMLFPTRAAATKFE